MTAVKQAAAAAEDTVRVALDANATVTRGPVARRGRRRVPVAAPDHDCPPPGTLTPVGLLRPALDERCRDAVTSRVTSDCLVDRLAPWWAAGRARCAHSTTLVRNRDNGPENHRQRTQFMHRRVPSAAAAGLTVRLADSPPYHRKDNPSARGWGLLAPHGHGTLLDDAHPVLRFAATMTWTGLRPGVTLGTTAYARGVTLTKAAMAGVEARLTRHPTLGNWFVDIHPPPDRESYFHARP